MTLLILLMAGIAVSILTVLIFSPFEPIDYEIRDALNYESNKDKMGKAIQK